jgi:hypothetical protein
VCGIFSFFILRALGELVLHRPSSGSFVSYAREFLGEKAAYVAGWMYFVNWAMTGIVDITAVALYMHYWGAFGDVPQWVFALGALAIVGTMNMIGVKWFAEMEFWFALVKVLAIVVFLVVGTVFLGSGKPLDGNAFITLVKTASEFVRRSEQQLHATLHQSVTVNSKTVRVTVLRDIVPDDDNPFSILSAHDGAQKLLVEPPCPPACKCSPWRPRPPTGAQKLLVERGWLPATAISKGSSCAMLAQTFPEEMCPCY